MPRPRRDVVGQRFERLTVLSETPSACDAELRCLCDCGTIVVARKTNVLSGNTRSCGCYRRGRCGKGRVAVVKPVKAIKDEKPQEFQIWRDDDDEF